MATSMAEPGTDYWPLGDCHHVIPQCAFADTAKSQGGGDGCSGEQARRATCQDAARHWRIPGLHCTGVQSSASFPVPISISQTIDMQLLRLEALLVWPVIKHPQCNKQQFARYVCMLRRPCSTSVSAGHLYVQPFHLICRAATELG